MRVLTNPLLPNQPDRRDVSIDYLRAFATLLVLVIHCSAPYTHIAKTMGPATWQSPVPILDSAASPLLDYVLTFLDVSVMSLMFFIAGLFTYPSLQRKGSLAYLKDRAMRLGLPFIAMTLLWMPLAYYAPWSLEHPGGSLRHFWTLDVHSMSASGPGWFLWMLLFFDCVVAFFYAVGGRWMARLIPRLVAFGQSPAAWAGLLVLAGIVFYIPLALRYRGLWLALLTPPFILQPARALFYAVWFSAGLLTGCSGLAAGLLARQGPLARRWAMWAIFGLCAGHLLWLSSLPITQGIAPDLRRLLLIDLLWVLADVGICFSLLSFFRAKVEGRRIWADSLARNAYAIYALHYVFALWIERWLLSKPLPAPVKFSIAMSGTLVLSWLTAIIWLRVWTWMTRGLAAPRSSRRETDAILELGTPVGSRESRKMQRRA